MAKPAKRRWRWLLAIPTAPLALLLLVLIAGWIGSAIPRNPDWREVAASDPRAVEIMVATNGVHTELVLPIVTPIKDWRTTFPTAANLREDGQLPTHIAVGWGEREVLLNTPTWADLHPATVWRIATRGGEGLMRIAHYVRPAPEENYRPLRLRPEEYRRLAARIEATLAPIAPGARRASYTGFQPGDMHYAAAGRYTLANTCNQWTADTLAFAGVRIGTWTPFAGGVMKWIDPPPSRRQ